MTSSVITYIQRHKEGEVVRDDGEIVEETKRGERSLKVRDADS